MTVCAGGGVNGSSVPAAVNAVAGSGLMMLNGTTAAAAAAMNPAASGLLMPNGAVAGNASVLMQRPVMLPSAGSPAAGGYLLAGGAGTTAPALLPQYVVGYPQQNAASPELASPYGMTVPPAAVYGQLCFTLIVIMFSAH